MRNSGNSHQSKTGIGCCSKLSSALISILGSFQKSSISWSFIFPQLTNRHHHRSGSLRAAIPIRSHSRFGPITNGSKYNFWRGYSWTSQCHSNSTYPLMLSLNWPSTEWPKRTSHQVLGRGGNPNLSHGHSLLAILTHHFSTRFESLKRHTIRRKLITCSVIGQFTLLAHSHDSLHTMIINTFSKPKDGSNYDIDYKHSIILSKECALTHLQKRIFGPCIAEISSHCLTLRKNFEHRRQTSGKISYSSMRQVFTKRKNLCTTSHGTLVIIKDHPFQSHSHHRSGLRWANIN